jgi:fimbrial chaperone protein
MQVQEATAYPAGRLLQRLAVLAGLALAGLAMPVMAATTISPILIDVPTGGRAIVTVRNDRARDVLYQVAVLSWQVVDGEDRHEPTQDFIASPPLFTLAPSASQIVRIGFRNPARLPVERAYRLVVAEVPTEASPLLPRPDDIRAEDRVIEFSVQYLLPVFVAPSSRGAKPSLVWSLRADGHTVVVRAENLGNRRAVLNRVCLSRQSGPDPAPEYTSTQRLTVLARSWREWRIAVPADKVSSPWRILYATGENTTATVLLDADIQTSASH